jgi:transposase
MCHNVVVCERHNERRRPDAGYHHRSRSRQYWFQVHGVDADGQVAIRRKSRRSEVFAFFRSLPPCLAGVEACAAAHHWARELTTLGHTVQLMPPAYVKAYVKRNKNDDADAWG